MVLPRSSVAAAACLLTRLQRNTAFHLYHRDFSLNTRVDLSIKRRNGGNIWQPKSRCLSRHTKLQNGKQQDNQYFSNNDTNNKEYTKYEQLVRHLYQTNVRNPAKLGLENMIQLYQALGCPIDNEDIKIVHVAGSNGKGSVCFKTAKALQYSGLRTGLFVSPHVSSFRERIQVDFEPISEEAVVRLLPQIFEICETENIPATFFEITTALAFAYFGECNVQAIALEVGLGGRLDSTNIVERPALSVITSIGLEHTRILGETIDEIATEKAGIVKYERPVLIGPNVPRHIVRAIADARKAPFYITSDESLAGNLCINEKDGVNNLDIADFDLENGQTATAALKLLRLDGISISDDAIQKGVSERPPCRFEEGKVRVNSNLGISKDVNFILDVAHNPSALEQLVTKIKTKYGRQGVRFIVGFSSDKDIKQCFNYLLSVSSEENIHLVQAFHPRAATFEQIIEAVPTLSSSLRDNVDRSITLQIEYGLHEAAKHDQILVVCGSVFIMSEAREALGFSEARDSDYIAEVAGAHLRHAQDNISEVVANPR